MSTLARIAQPIVLSFGVRRALIAFLAGGATTLAMPPIGFWPALLLTFPVAVWLIDGAGIGRWNGALAAAAAGWWFGFGYFLSGLYWVGAAFLVDADRFAALMPVAVLVLPGGMAIYTAFGFGLARALWTGNALRIVTLAGTLTLAEFLRGHMLSGFPWNAFGYAFATPLPLAQGFSLIGLWGMTFLAVLVLASPAVLADGPSGGRGRFVLPAVSLLLLAALAVFGAVRLATTPTTTVDGVRLRLMQPNVPQDQRFGYAAKADIMRRYLALSGRTTAARPNGIADVTHLIWPESAFPFFVTREADALAAIADLLPEGTVLITGGARLADGSRPGHVRAYNSVYVFDDAGSILSIYDKVHLVPFGEYVPLGSLLTRLGLEQLVRIPGGFLAGDRLRRLDLPGAPPVVPLVCYEAVFPNAVVPPGERPGWLLNLTNDAWFGISPGPFQHLLQARMRAVEEGLPLVRVANTGISVVVDPLGRIVAELGLGREGVLDSGLPAAIAPTVYAKAGDAPALIAIALTLVAGVRARLRVLKAADRGR